LQTIYESFVHPDPANINSDEFISKELTMRLPRLNLLRVNAAILLTALAIGAATESRAAFINLTPTNGVNSSTSVPLSDLISGTVMGVTVGDKIFSGFNYSFDGDMPQAVNVQVLGFKDQNGNYGVSFHGTFLDMPGGAPSDAAIRFVVDIDPAFLNSGFRISDAHMFLSGSGVGADSAFMVDESFLESPTQTLNVFNSSINGGGTKLSDSADFNPTLTRLHVTKDILAIAGANAILPARATVIDQSFSQVPEPVTIMISMIGCVGLFGLKRRQRS